jgi:hypothetical protein
LEFGGTFELDWRAGELADLSWKAAQGVMRDMTHDIVAQAKENVAPGKGPKPHETPYEMKGIHGLDVDDAMFVWEDTGQLADSITAKVGEKKGFLQVSIWSDTDKTEGVPYGMYLELGFQPTNLHDPGFRRGNLFRYPWLAPAALQVSEQYRDMMPRKFRHHLHDSVARANKKKSLKILRPITEAGTRMIAAHRYTTRDQGDLDIYGYDGRQDVDMEMVDDSFRNT